MMIAAVAAVFAIQYALMELNYFPTELESLNSWHIFTLIAVQASVFVIFSIFLIFRFKVRIFDLGDELRWTDILFGMVGLFALNMASSAFLLALDAAPDQFQDFNISLLKEDTGLLFFTIAFLGPVYEEFIFRSVILGMLVIAVEDRKKWVIAAVYSSLLFAGAHFRDILENFYIGIPLFLLGLYFSYWTLKKKGIMLPIVLHMTQNFLATMAMVYGKSV